MSPVALLDNFSNKIEKIFGKNPFQYLLLVLKIVE